MPCISCVTIDMADDEDGYNEDDGSWGLVCIECGADADCEAVYCSVCGLPFEDDDEADDCDDEENDAVE